ncbi:MAG: excinuclease ABC subunit B [Spirochaetales bacterium]|nr:excinuclease ABC subunit B [Spirochaetales bacterium]
MPDFKLHSPYEAAGDQIEAIRTLSDGVREGIPRQVLKGVTGSGKTFTMARIIENSKLPTLVISHNKTLAAQLYREFKDFFPENRVEYFVSYYDYYQPEAYVPSKDLYIEKDATINEEIDRLRLSATSSLLERNDVIVVATVSCIYGLGSPASYFEMRLPLTKGDQINLQSVSLHLISLQYDRDNIMLSRGSFRIKGDVLEIFPAYMKEAFRIQLEFDEIIRIERINTVSGAPIEEIDSCMIYPAKHFVMPQDQIAKALDQIRDELNIRYAELNKANRLVEAQRLKTRTEYDLEMLEEVGYCSGIENYSRHLSNRAPGERPGVLLDYFPEHFLTFIDESHVTVPQIGGMYEGDRARKMNLVEHGFRLPSALDNRPLYYAEFNSLLDTIVYVSATPRKFELDDSKRVVEQIIRPTGLVDPEIIVRPTHGQIEDLYARIKERVAQKERVLVTTLTKKMAEDLTDYFSNLNLKVRYLHSEIETLERVEILRDLRSGIFDVLIGINLLREGLDLPEVSLIGILDADKIGFLRSATSLIQTIGRAARNVNGQVIMYADKVSDAMKEAIDETERRRKLQQAYNTEHGITPVTIQKAVHDILERKKEEKNKNEKMNIDVLRNSFNLLVEKERKAYIRMLEKEMLEHAKNLEFEQAAVIRDEIENIKSTYNG